MHKESTLVTALLVAACAAAPGCAPEAPRPAVVEDGGASSVIGSVEVFNEPLAWVVERLAAPLVEVRFRTAESPDPAYWKPSAEDVLAMQQADLVVLNGASYEGWLNTVSLPVSRLVDTTAGVSERLMEGGSTVTHSHGPEGQHEHTGTAFTTWLDPTMLVEQASAVRAALAARWPEHEGLFNERFAALAADLGALDSELEAATAAAGARPVVFSHPVYQYLQRRYGLNGESVHWEPEIMPDDAQWAEFDHLLEHRPAAWMIWEAEPDPSIVEALAERGCSVIVVSPCALPPKQSDFLEIMRGNAAALGAAFLSK